MMITAQLKALKDKKKVTNQQLADLSGVPLGTINRILSGQTDNPSFQTVSDLVIALNGSLDELAGIRPAEGGEQEPLSSSAATLYQQMIRSKDMWLRRMFVVCCVLVSFILGVLIFDLLNPAIGFFRY